MTSSELLTPPGRNVRYQYECSVKQRGQRAFTTIARNARRRPLVVAVWRPMREFDLEAHVCRDRLGRQIWCVDDPLLSPGDEQPPERAPPLATHEAYPVLQAPMGRRFDLRV